MLLDTLVSSTNLDTGEEKFYTLFWSLIFRMNMKFTCIASWGHCKEWC